MIIEDALHCKLEYDSRLKSVIQTWKGYARSKDFRDSILKTIEFFQNNPEVKHILSNTLNSGVVKKEDADWVVNYANPILMKHGLQKIAFLVPESVLAKWSVEHFTQKSQDELIIQYFSELEHAKKWLAE